MKFAVFTHVFHFKKGDAYCAYRPYVREMNLWLKEADRFILVAPLSSGDPDNPILGTYNHSRIAFHRVPAFNITNLQNTIRTVFLMPILLWKIFSSMWSADHIHIRCPGNMGLLACLIQILFPSKPKTVKYAGNWSPNSSQPRSYRFQKFILKSTFLTKNAKVLVYGDFGDKSKNIVPFFTASYSETRRESTKPRKPEGRIRFVFAGSLNEGKDPLLACRVVNLLIESGLDCDLRLYGDGPLRKSVDEYAVEKGKEERIRSMGNTDENTLSSALMESHFLLCLSRSEGWPKVVAEAMWWGCLPVATPVSCVPQMLDQGNRGLLVLPYAESVIAHIRASLNNHQKYLEKCSNAMEWSRQYTLEHFESEIRKIMNN